MKRLSVYIAAITGLITGCTAQSSVKVLEPEEFITAAKADSTSVILDVRRPDEFAEGHIAGATNIDWLDTETFTKRKNALNKDRTYYIYCRSGRRSNSAAATMQAEGFKVFDMKGGILEWNRLGMPVVE